jgi:hypothetical protein
MTCFPSFNWMRGVRAEKRISILHRFVLLSLMIERKNDGRYNKGYDAIVRATGVHRASVIRAIEAGVRCGWLAPPIRHRREHADLVFTFPLRDDDQEVRTLRHQEDDQEVAPERHQDDQEVAADEVKKSQRQRASRAKSNPSTRLGLKRGQERKRGQESDSRAPDFFASGEEKKDSPSAKKQETIPTRNSINFGPPIRNASPGRRRTRHGRPRSSGASRPM